MVFWTICLRHSFGDLRHIHCPLMRDRAIREWTIHGRFGSLPVRHLDVSHLWAFRHTRTSLDVSPTVAKFAICDTVRTSLSSCGETSREVLVCLTTPKCSVSVQLVMH